MYLSPQNSDCREGFISIFLRENASFLGVKWGEVLGF
jgi:hypothetical protein